MPLSQRVLDFGLNVLDTEASHAYLCNATPTTYAEVTTFAVGVKAYVRGNMFGSPAPTFGGRKVTLIRSIDGSVQVSDLAVCLAIVDTTLGNLLATFDIPGLAVNAGDGFILEPFDVAFAMVSNIAVFVALPFAVSPPTRTNPALTQKHAIAASAFAPASPVLESLPLQQKQVFSATSIASSSPVLANPDVVQVAKPVPTSLTVASPVIGSPLVTINGWAGQAFAAQNGLFDVSADVMLSQAGADVVFGLSSGTPTGFGDQACILRANTSNQFDARNGGVYAVTNAVPYTPGVLYRIRFFGNVATHIYNVLVTPQSQAAVLLANNFAFRTEQDTVAALDFFGKFAGIGDGSFGNILVNVIMPAATALAVSSPVLGTLPVKQAHAIAATPIGITPPVLGSPPVVQKQVFAGTPIAVSSPVLGTLPITQKHVFAPTSKVTSSPVLGTPVVGGISAMAPAISLAVGSPAPGKPLPMLTGWTNRPIGPISGVFSVIFTAQPTLSVEDAVIGLSLASEPPSTWNDLACTVRFFTNGFIDAINAGVYTVTNTVPYVAGQKFDIRITGSTVTDLYSVFVTPPGQAEITLASNFVFRTGTAAIASIGNLCKGPLSGDVILGDLVVTASYSIAATNLVVASPIIPVGLLNFSGVYNFTATSKTVASPVIGTPTASGGGASTWPTINNTGLEGLGNPALTVWSFGNVLDNSSKGNFPTDPQGRALVQNYDLTDVSLYLTNNSSGWHFKGCKFRVSSQEGFNLHIDFGCDNWLIEYCEFGSNDGNKVTFTPTWPGGINHCITNLNAGTGVGPMEISHCQFYHFATMIVFADGTYIHDCYAFNCRNDGGQDHTDGIYCNGGDNTNLDHNWIEIHLGQTDCVALFNGSNPSDGNHVNIRVTNNFFAGGGYSLYGGAANGGADTGHVINGVFTGNRFSTKFFANCGAFGPYTGDPRTNGGTGITWSNNKMTDATGTVDGATLP